ncbi:MAG: DR2241 family protein [Haloarculaceae archaeon]
MNDDQLDALVAAADDGVDRDGLVVEATDAGYRFVTPGEAREGLDEAGLRAAAAENPWFVSNWHVWTDVPGTDADRAFLRWLEDAASRSVPERYERLADGVTRTWGQLRLTVTLGTDGERRYEVRHEDDAGAEPAALAVHADPLDARDLVATDERGRYRPLKTAPTLRSGWVFPDLDAAGLLRTVETVYPATVANWHREREGALDVTHWEETARRQTGIYDVVEDLPDAAVEWMAEACCVDSQCLKRREWDRTADGSLDVPRGDGEFPCREPCSLVVAAAREWTALEREETRTYQLELTPSERDQLDDVVDAVAEGRIDEIREADVAEGANRYRVRYLRAKRFGGDGDAQEETR